MPRGGCTCSAGRRPPSSGPTLLFVQGWPDNLTLWDELVAALRDRYRCVRVNLPGHPGAESLRWGHDTTGCVAALSQCAA